jgi:hypothetical protein
MMIAWKSLCDAMLLVHSFWRNASGAWFPAHGFRRMACSASCARISAHGFPRKGAGGLLPAHCYRRTTSGARLPAHGYGFRRAHGRRRTASGRRTASHDFPRTASRARLSRAQLPAGARLPAHGFQRTASGSESRALPLPHWHASGFPRMASRRIPLPAHARPNKRQNSVDLDTAKRHAKLYFGSLFRPAGRS